MSRSRTHARPHSNSSAAASGPAAPKPPRLLPRSPSDPIHLAQGQAQSSSISSPNSPSQPIYVLTADGSSLFLLDPSKPQGGEEPPPYASFTIPSQDGDDEDQDEGGGIAPGSRSTTFGRAGELILSGGAVGNRNVSCIGEDGSGNHPYEYTGENEYLGARHRARTLSALASERERPSRPRYHSSLSHPNRRTRSALSTPETHSVRLIVDENTPLLAPPRGDPEEIAGAVADIGNEPTRRRGLWRSVWCGELDDDEEVGGWVRGWKRFWRPLGRRIYWRAIIHLVLLNFPFALFVWPFLVAGTLAGTALLITLPIGAAVWWLTLFISRSAARLETIMQLHHHSPLSPTTPAPTYHTIFYRMVPRSPVNSPLPTPIAYQPHLHAHAYPQSYAHSHSVQPQTLNLPPSPPESPGALESSPMYEPNLSSSTSSLNPTMGMVWEKRFMKCSYAMFLDHYSYSALSYFLLIKPLITLFSTIVIIALLPIGFGTIVLLPVYLRLLRRWGRWQAEVAVENL
ncbi:hypothetical protein I317_06980 [Kwoniella heveanensis CBS 569]|uniref:Uncharacterized protein n=1 Tax=Kwoniella heveanensis BCC8398 TaxID=1296120 RepID=A0A1B9GQS4_9TREE|nr:hypothetical protein I316_04790 [Kwoniella heveanensis BCC8398]OCF39211.1 hypothetical protein I317_06980 [Kwoniella heveanensis CBS 569]